MTSERNRTMLYDALKSALSHLETLPNSVNVGESCRTTVILRLHGTPDAPILVDSTSFTMKRYGMQFTIEHEERAGCYGITCARQAMGVFYALQELHRELVLLQQTQRESVFAYRVDFGILPLEYNLDLHVSVQFYCCFIPLEAFAPCVPMELELVAFAVR